MHENIVSCTTHFRELTLRCFFSFFKSSTILLLCKTQSIYIYIYNLIIKA